MRFSFPSVILVCSVSLAADVESRRLTHYLPQDFLETVVRTENWTEVPLDIKGGLGKEDVVRVWSGGLIDRGNGEQPGINCVGPEGAGLQEKAAGVLSAAESHAFALLFKTESSGPVNCLMPGKPLEIKLTKDKERIWIGFNDEKGRYLDNHLGKGKRHELDPAWVRIEVVRIVVD